MNASLLLIKRRTVRTMHFHAPQEYKLSSTTNTSTESTLQKSLKMFGIPSVDFEYPRQSAWLESATPVYQQDKRAAPKLNQEIRPFEVESVWNSFKNRIYVESESLTSSLGLWRYTSWTFRLAEAARIAFQQLDVIPRDDVMDSSVRKSFLKTKRMFLSFFGWKDQDVGSPGLVGNLILEHFPIWCWDALSLLQALVIA